jgi:hypothetical protein
MQVCLRTSEFLRTMDGHPTVEPTQTLLRGGAAVQQRVAAHEHSEDNDCICTSKRLIYRFALMQSLATLQQRYCCMLLDIAAASSQLQTLLSRIAEVIELQFHSQELRQGGQHKAANSINHTTHTIFYCILRLHRFSQILAQPRHRVLGKRPS